MKINIRNLKWFSMILIHKTIYLLTSVRLQKNRLTYKIWKLSVVYLDLLNLSTVKTIYLWFTNWKFIIRKEIKPERVKREKGYLRLQSYKWEIKCTTNDVKSQPDWIVIVKLGKQFVTYLHVNLYYKSFPKLNRLKVI